MTVIASFSLVECIYFVDVHLQFRGQIILKYKGLHRNWLQLFLSIILLLLAYIKLLQNLVLLELREEQEGKYESRLKTSANIE